MRLSAKTIFLAAIAAFFVRLFTRGGLFTSLPGRELLLFSVAWFLFGKSRRSKLDFSRFVIAPTIVAWAGSWASSLTVSTFFLPNNFLAFAAVLGVGINSKVLERPSWGWLTSVGFVGLILDLAFFQASLDITVRDAQGLIRGSNGADIAFGHGAIADSLGLSVAFALFLSLVIIDERILKNDLSAVAELQKKAS